MVTWALFGGRKIRSPVSTKFIFHERSFNVGFFATLLFLLKISSVGFIHFSPFFCLPFSIIGVVLGKMADLSVLAWVGFSRSCGGDGGDGGDGGCGHG